MFMFVDAVLGSEDLIIQHGRVRAGNTYQTKDCKKFACAHLPRIDSSSVRPLAASALNLPPYSRKLPQLWL